MKGGNPFEASIEDFLRYAFLIVGDVGAQGIATGPKNSSHAVFGTHVVLEVAIVAQEIMELPIGSLHV
jgi:hypothetical protein